MLSHGLGLPNTAFCPKNTSPRPRHHCVFLSRSAGREAASFPRLGKHPAPLMLRLHKGALGPGWQQENAAGKQSSSCRGRHCGGFTSLTTRSGWQKATEAAPGEALGPAAFAGCWLKELSERHSISLAILHGELPIKDIPTVYSRAIKIKKPTRRIL